MLLVFAHLQESVFIHKYGKRPDRQRGYFKDLGFLLFVVLFCLFGVFFKVCALEV